MIIFMCTVFWFTVCKVNANSCTVIGCSMQEGHSLNRCSMFTVCSSSTQAGDFLTDAQCLVTICWVMVTICWVMVTICRVMVTICRVMVTICRVLSAGSWLLSAGSWLFNTSICSVVASFHNHVRGGKSGMSSNFAYAQTYSMGDHRVIATIVYESLSFLFTQTPMSQSIYPVGKIPATLCG